MTGGQADSKRTGASRLASADRARGPSRAGGSRGVSVRDRQSRPKLTGRAAVLAVVLCAIALSLAYPIREYIAQRRQIDQLVTQHAALLVRLKDLAARRAELSTPGYIEQQARDQLHMCFPSQRCYEVVGTGSKRHPAGQAIVASPWYRRLWQSVEQADRPAQPDTAAARHRSSVRHRPHRTHQAGTPPG
jgi:cell division protein FtsB